MSTPAPTRPPTSRSTAAFVAIMSMMAAVALSVLLLHATIALTAHANGHPAPPLTSTARAVVARPGDPVSALGEPIGPTWPPYALWGAVLGLLLLAGWRVLLAWGRRRYREAPTTASLAGAADVAPLQEQQAVARARRIGGQAVANMSAKDLVVPLGYVGSKRIYVQHEDSILVVAPSRSGKTSGCVIGWVVDAPGPVIVTSTKNDVLFRTILARLRFGTAGVFDLRNISGWRERVVWDLVAGCLDPAEAVARATAMASAAPSGGTTNGDWFNALAARVLGYLLHAAALKPGGDASDVLAWASDFDNLEAVDVLRQFGAPRAGEERPDTSSWAELLASSTRNESAQTVGSMQVTLLGILEPLSDPAVLAAACPQAGAPVFDVQQFLTTRSTLYLLSKGGRKSVAPIITAFADMILRTADEMSQHLPGGRFWPPVTLVGDEIANIAPLPDLDQLISDSGGRGISVRIVAQTKAQLIKRWGREQAEAIVAGVNAILALPSITEQDVLQHLSFLTGQHRVARISVTESDGRTSATTSGERENRMSEDEIHTMAMGTALLVAGNAPAVHLRLTPWFERPDAEQLRQDSEEVERITGRRMEQ